MKNPHAHLLAIFAASLGTVFSANAIACSSCNCSLDSDWDSQGYAIEQGWRIELRHDYLNQSQLRSGTEAVNRAAIMIPNDREIEQSTLNRYTTVGLDYSSGDAWGVNLQLPYIDRAHSTIAPGDTDVSTSHTHAIGDMRVLGRYFLPTYQLGLQFGFKLPSGDFHDSFHTGPQTASQLDRGLQAGTGTTDVLLGVYHFGQIAEKWKYFTQGVWQQSLNERDGYQTGSSLNFNAGIRYVISDSIVPHLQINAKWSARDRGVNADSDNSGGKLVYLSPGVTLGITDQLKMFGFLQLPIYQNVNGYQLAPKYTVSMGVRYTL